MWAKSEHTHHLHDSRVDSAWDQVGEGRVESSDPENHARGKKTYPDELRYCIASFHAPIRIRHNHVYALGIGNQFSVRAFRNFFVAKWLVQA